MNLENCGDVSMRLCGGGGGVRYGGRDLTCRLPTEWPCYTRGGGG